MHWIDPSHLPETTGTVERFLLNPHGDADGLLLTDGTEVHFPPHLSKQVLTVFKPGDEVKVRGIHPRGVDHLLAAVSLESANGTRIIDQGPPKDHGDHKAEPRHAADAYKPVEVEGVVRRVVHGPKGEVRGVLLEDGRIVRVSQHATAALRHLLAPGHTLVARGEELTNALGTVIAARKIGDSHATLRPIEPKKSDGHDEHRPAKHDKPSKRLEAAE